MKDYYSTLDLRAWSDVIEERRRHILEYQAKNTEVNIIQFENYFTSSYQIFGALNTWVKSKIFKKLDIITIYSGTEH